jgi:hypothetical protein
MSPRHRCVSVILLTLFLAGCGVEPTAPATASPSGVPSAASSSPSPATASPSSVVPTVLPSVVIPSPSDTGTPNVSPGPSPSPGQRGDFVTPVPPGAATAWTGIRWRKLAASDPLAQVRSVTRWRGGFVAVGDVAIAGGANHNKVWISADGRSWDLLGGDVFGETSMVVGVAATADTVVLMTLQSAIVDGDPGMTGPWQTWTSSDGASWVAHPGPDFAVPRAMGTDFHPTLVSGAGNHLIALTLDGQPLAFSPDGIAWTTASLADFPGGAAGWQGQAIETFPPGFLAVGYATGKPVALVSADGRAWTRYAIPTTCAPTAIIAGARGVIVSGEIGDPHSPKTFWCSSLNGRAWRTLPNLPPLGYSRVNDECRGVCPNGTLHGNGERMLAFRGSPNLIGWTSFDGRSWRRLTFAGSRPTGLGTHFFNGFLTSIGLLLIDGNNGTAWFGQPMP